MSSGWGKNWNRLHAAKKEQMELQPYRKPQQYPDLKGIKAHEEVLERKRIKEQSGEVWEA